LTSESVTCKGCINWTWDTFFHVICKVLLLMAHTLVIIYWEYIHALMWHLVWKVSFFPSPNLGKNEVQLRMLMVWNMHIDYVMNKVKNKWWFFHSFIVQWAQCKLFSLFCLHDILTISYTFHLNSFQERFTPGLSFPHLLILRLKVYTLL